MGKVAFMNSLLTGVLEINFISSFLGVDHLLKVMLWHSAFIESQTSKTHSKKGFSLQTDQPWPTMLYVGLEKPLARTKHLLVYKEAHLTMPKLLRAPWLAWHGSDTTSPQKVPAVVVVSDLLYPWAACSLMTVQAGLVKNPEVCHTQHGSKRSVDGDDWGNPLGSACVHKLQTRRCVCVEEVGRSLDVCRRSRSLPSPHFLRGKLMIGRKT